MILGNRTGRRLLGALLIVVGGVLMWSAASPVGGLLLLALAIVIEVIGIRLEHR